MSELLDASKLDLVTANRILGAEGILDAYGHVSLRHPDHADVFILTRARSPENVEVDDVLEFGLDGTLLGSSDSIPYIERFIHAAIYEARPDVHAVCHNHAFSILPFSISKTTTLTATINSSRLFGSGVPVWDIADEFGPATDMLVRDIAQGRSLARSLGSGTVALMRGHGSAVVSRDARGIVSSCLSMNRGAMAQLSVMTLGEIRTFTDVELQPHPRLPAGATVDDRAWEYFQQRVGTAQ